MNKASFDSLVDQAHDLIVQIPSLFSQPGQVEQAREVALACHKHMLELGDQNRAEAIPLALAGAELFLALINHASPQPDWVSIHEEQCCRSGATWIIDLIQEEYPGAELWREQGIVLLKRLDRLHGTAFEWIAVMLAFLLKLPPPDFPVSQKPKIVIVGNCQAHPLMLGLRQKLSETEIYFCPSVHLATTDDVANLHSELANANALIMHRVQPGYRDNIGLDSPSLRALLPKTSRSFVLPNLHYEGYFPWTTYAQDPDGRLPALEVESPLGAYHDFLAMAAAEEGLEGSQLLEYPCTTRLADLLLEAHEQSLNELSKRESDCDVVISDWIASNFRNIPLAHTMNHPTQATLNQLLRRLLGKLNSTPSIGPELSNNIEYLGELSLPIHPWVRQSLRLSPWACQWGKRREKRLTIEAQLNESIAFYRKYPWIAVANANHPKLQFAKTCLNLNL